MWTQLRKKRVLTHGAIASLLGSLLVTLSLSISAPALADEALPRTPSPDGATCYLITPADGESVKSPVTVRFGLSAMGVAPAGIEKGGTGHHHLLIDSELKNWGVPIPNDAQHRHFGGGQTEVTLDLQPGRHTLQLVLADHRHIPHEPPIVSKVITITVE